MKRRHFLAGSVAAISMLRDPSSLAQNSSMKRFGDDLWAWDATDLALAIRRGEVSAREATESVLRRVEQVNPRINAIVDSLADEALAAADWADSARAAGRILGPLHGVPITIKDVEDYKGRPTTLGVVAFKDRIAPEDGACVRSLKASGAVIIGRTNCPAFAYRWFTENDLFGRTLNPWNEEITPGGSSGGAAASVALGMGALGHGDDLGGSIRYPAYACGLVGIRPTPGRLPFYSPLEFAKGETWPVGTQLMLVPGIIGRRVMDTRLGYEALMQPDPRDPHWVPAKTDFPPDKGPIRVGLFSRAEGVDADPSASASVRRAGEALANAGYDVEEIDLPGYSELVELWIRIVINESMLGLSDIIMEHGDERMKNAMRAYIGNTQKVDLAGMEAAFGRRSHMMKQWAQLMNRYPVLIMPTSWQRPFPIDLDQQGVEVMGRILQAQGPMLALAVLGLPVVAVPTGVDQGLPAGVQVVAKAFREDRCFEVAALIEAAYPMPTPL